MELETKVIRNTLVVRIKGEMDLYVTDNLRQEIYGFFENNNKMKQLILNLTGVSFIDSSGLGLIIGCYKKVTADKGQMYIVGAQPTVEKILYFSGINKLIPILGSEQEVFHKSMEKIRR